jgi:hypothetical protein
MGEVIKVDFCMRWRKAVYVGDDDRLTSAIAGPPAAITFMKTKFRFHDGDAYSRALKICHDAVEGKIAPSEARKPFVDAYAEDCVRSWESHEMQPMEGES